MILGASRLDDEVDAASRWAEIAEQVGETSPDAVRMECLLKVIPAMAAALAEGDR